MIDIVMIGVNSSEFIINNHSYRKIDIISTWISCSISLKLFKYSYTLPITNWPIDIVLFKYTNIAYILEAKLLYNLLDSLLKVSNNPGWIEAVLFWNFNLQMAFFSTLHMLAIEIKLSITDWRTYRLADCSWMEKSFAFWIRWIS